MYAIDRRQTDVRRQTSDAHHRLMSPPRGRGHNKLLALMFRSGHCLYTLLLDLRMIYIVLRSSVTSFNLPQCNYVQTIVCQEMSFSRLLLICFAVFCTVCFYYNILNFLYFNWMAFVCLNKRDVMLYVMIQRRWRLLTYCLYNNSTFTCLLTYLKRLWSFGWKLERVARPAGEPYRRWR